MREPEIDKTRAPHPPLVHVCPLAELGTALAATQARHLVSVINSGTIPDTPLGVSPERHLRLGVNDIVTPQAGLIHPSGEHIAAVIAFARSWNRDGPLLVHCWAGISRSTAAAFIAICTLNAASERRIAEVLREASPSATPNRLMVAIADDLLVRSGRMVDAVDAIGAGEPAPMGRLFALPSRFER